jgi:serine/threonine-protein kinase
MQNPAMRVVLADDAALLRAGVAHVLRTAGVEVVAEVGDAAALLNAVGEFRPQLAVVDIRMPPTHTAEGVDAALAIRRDHPGTGVLLLSQYVQSAQAVDLLAAGYGAVGYLLKERVVDVAEFVDAAHRVAGGETVIDPELVKQMMLEAEHERRHDALSERERQVLALMAEGHSNRAIGARMFLTERTVETHIGWIFQKLGLAAEADTNRRVLAVLAHLRSSEPPNTSRSDAG